jgi:type VI secretion system protein ImpG
LEQLLPYYERELGFLRRYSREFSERYPKIAGRLLIGGEVRGPAHRTHDRVLRAAEFAHRQAARRRLPEFTEALFEVLYPHYLRPFPSCSIARMDFSGAAAQLTTASEIARGTQLTTRPVRGATCTFRTAYPVTVAPLALSGAQFDAIIAAPEAVRPPPQTTSSISLTLSCTAEQVTLAQLGSASCACSSTANRRSAPRCAMRCSRARWPPMWKRMAMAAGASCTNSGVAGRLWRG